MNAHDWFDEHDVKGQLKELVTKLESTDPDLSDKTRLEIFVEGLKGIMNSAHGFHDVAPMFIRTFIESQEGEDSSINHKIRQAFSAITFNAGDEYELMQLKYREGSHIVDVDFQYRDDE